MIAESEFTVRGHGVHTAYVEITNALRQQPNIDVKVNTRRSADIVHSHSPGPYAISCLHKAGQAKKVISGHVVPASLIGSLRLANLWSPIARSYLRWYYNKADLVLAVSEETVDGLSKMGVENVKLLHNGIDIEQYKISASDRRQVRQALGIEPDDIVVVGNGQVQPRKRFDLFIDLACAIPEVKFFWVGGIPRLGAQYRKMKSLVRQAPKNVTVTGVIELEDVKKYYQAADIFIMPSVQETFGLAILEAAAAGLPLLIRDIPDYQNTFSSGAMLAKNDEEFEQKLRQLATDSKLRRKYAALAKTIAQRFDSKKQAKDLVKYYQQLLKE
jgi:1,2-diacylglycerol-3-alpha-glucose alpha-1,2-galactosyltransferase